MIESAYAAGDMVQTVATPGLKEWFAAHTEDILICCAALLVGYAASQHYKNSKHPKPSREALWAVNGVVSFVFVVWWLPDVYTLHQQVKVASGVGILSPFLVAGIFEVIDKFFPGKGETLKNGIFIDEAPEEDPTIMAQATKLAAAAVVGKKRNRREVKRGSPDSAKTEVWTPEQREAITGRKYPNG